jgi:hypothetical protein
MPESNCPTWGSDRPRASHATASTELTSRDFHPTIAATEDAKSLLLQNSQGRRAAIELALFHLYVDRMRKHRMEFQLWTRVRGRGPGLLRLIMGYRPPIAVARTIEFIVGKGE